VPGVKPRFFATPAEFRAWLARNHAKAPELLVGFHKKGSGKPGMDWPQSVDEALCHGWIDGVRRSLGDTSYCIRFTPRKPTSNWSAINIRRVHELKKLGRMTPAGLAAFAKREKKRSAIYAYEQPRMAELAPAETRALKANAAARDFLENVAPSYRRVVLHWIVTAKKPETRAARLAKLIAASAQGKRL
jgi:uncharacterized protein YdeI (YjbR/CyaY-like superfamily)